MKGRFERAGRSPADFRQPPTNRGLEQLARIFVSGPARSPSDRNDGSSPVRRERSASSGLILHDGSAVSRAPGPLGRLRQCRRRPGMRRLYPNAWYRASAHPARVSAARWPACVSRSSRRRISARTSASSTAPPAGLQLDGAAAGAHLGGCGDEDLHVGVREDDRSDVAAVEHRARRGAAEIALEGEQRLAHLRDGRNPRGRLADRVGFEPNFVELAGIERARRRRPPARDRRADGRRRAAPCATAR